MATKGPHDVAHTLNVASTIVSKYLKNAFLKYVTLFSLPLSPVSCFLKQPLRLFFRWQPSWNPSRIAKMAIRSIRLSNGCQVCCQKEIYQSNLQTMLIYAIFNTFWGVRRSRPKTVFHAQKRSFTTKNNLSRPNHAPITLPILAKPIFLGVQHGSLWQRKVSWLESNDLSILKLLDFML